jgi:hypothetical protein
MVKGTKFHLFMFPGEETGRREEELPGILERQYPGLIEFHSIPLGGGAGEVYERFGIRRQLLFHPPGWTYCI